MQPGFGEAPSGRDGAGDLLLIELSFGVERYERSPWIGLIALLDRLLRRPKLFPLH